jgi:RNA polymerase sigma-70 factor (ECF subfamily)
VGSQQYEASFDKIYHLTYKKALRYITAKCGDPGDISDILQEAYAELYRVLQSKGDSYIQNPEAFVMQLVKSKVYKYYSLRDKLRNILPIQGTSRDDGENDCCDSGLLEGDADVETLVEDRLLLREISDFLKTKSHDVQRIFYLYYVLELPSAQIAADLNLKESTVKSKIHRTVHEVRALYGKAGEKR